MRFCLVNLGCKVNRVEADSIAAQLVAHGWDQVQSDADIAIVNTCTVTGEADRKTRKEINRAVAGNPRARIVVTGCAAAIDPSMLSALSDRVEIVPKDSVVDACLKADGKGYAHMPNVLRVGGTFPTRVGIKVQDGCDNACTFCIVHVARGKARSYPVDACVEQVQAYANAGVREVVLTGIDLGAYCADDVSLAGLVRTLRSAVPDVRLRISSIEPNTIDDALVELLATQDGMVCRHLHVPLQAGSDRVLHDMARRYSIQEYLDTVAALRAAVPQLSLSTDVIAGFPGETDADFADTVAAARACGFSRMHVFRYSKRAGTPAAQRSDQVAPAVAAARAAQLQEVAGGLRMQDAQARVGTNELVLVESDGRGMSESYFEVNMPHDALRGSLVDVVLGSVGEDGTFNL